jgi:hypothetical protein
MIKVRISIISPDEENEGNFIDEYAEGLEMPAVPRAGDMMTYKIGDESQLSRDTRDRIGPGVWMYSVKSVHWHAQDPSAVDVFLVLMRD